MFLFQRASIQRKTSTREKCPRMVDSNASLTVLCKTTAGDVYIDVFDRWSPRGARRFLKLLSLNFFDKMALYRAVPHFLVQFGIPATSSLMKLSASSDLKPIKDDESLNIPFDDGTLSFAGNGVNSRTNELFFTLGSQPGLGKAPWETPIGRVQKRSLPIIHAIYTDYGDFINGNGPRPAIIKAKGYSYLKSEFPKLDYIESCSIKKEFQKRTYTQGNGVQNKIRHSVVSKILPFSFGGEQLILENRQIKTHGWYTDDGALFDDGSRWKHKTSASHVVFMVVFMFLLIRCFRYACINRFCFSCSFKSAKTKDSASEHRTIGEGTWKDKALDYSDSVEDLKNVVTNSMQGKMYAYKNRKRRRRRQLTYEVYNV